MALTRLSAETELATRVGGLMTAVGLTATASGSNTVYGSALGWGVRQAGGTAATFSNPTDAEIAAVTNEDKLLDFAELRTLQTIQRNNGLVDRADATVRWDYGQLAARIAAAIADAQARCALYGSVATGSAFSVLPTRADGYATLADDE